MKLLSVDTSTPYESVALTIDGEIVVERGRLAKRGHGPGLLEDIDAALRAANLTLEDLDAFCTGLGPGSFTGVRIAMATLKGLAFATQKPLYGISTLDVLAAPFENFRPLAILDARRGEVYTEGFGVSLCCASPEFVAEQVKEAPGVVVGDGALAYEEIWRKAWPNAVIPTSRAAHWPRAAEMANLLQRRLDNGLEAPALATLEPCYARRSDAEINYPDGFPDAFGAFKASN